MRSEQACDVAIVVLNYNGRQHLEYCIPSIIQNTDLESSRVIVVDNASMDDSSAFLSQFPQIEMIRNATNLGYAGGCNVGIRRAIELDSRYVVVANNDILVCPLWIAASCAYMDENPSVGVLGYNVFGATGRVARDTFHEAVRNFVSLSVEEVENVPGMAVMFRMDVLRAVGLFDEIIFMYGEEDDLETRISEAGYRIVRCNLPIWHYSEGTSRREIPFRSSYLAYRNGLRADVKYRGLVRFGLSSTYTLARALLTSPSSVLNADSLARRMFPGSRARNTAIVLAAISWNVLHALETMRVRRVELEKIRVCRDQAEKLRNRSSESR